VMYYYVTSSGDVVFGVNGEDKGVFFSGVDTRRQLWGLVDVYGNSNVIELVDPRRSLNNMLSNQAPKSPAPQRIQAPRIPEPRLRRSESCGRIPNYVESSYYGSKRLARAAFHRGCVGQNVSLNQTASIATRTDTEFCNGYVFLDSPLQPGESLVIRVLETESTYIGSLAFGLTGADPRNLTSSSLPEDSELLLQRPEYWVLSKDVLANPHSGDEICYTLGLDGAVLCSINNGPDRVIFHSDISIPTRPFIDIYGVAQRIQLLGVAPASHPTSHTPTIRRSVRPSKASPRPKSCSPQSLPSLDISQDSGMVQNECVICYESDVDCVLYSCGHMCMCFSCAVQQFNSSGECPLCRATIRDVIRTYRA